MSHRPTHLVVAAASLAAALATAPLAMGANVVYLEQQRRVEAAWTDGVQGPFFGLDAQDAPNFSPWDATAVSHHLDEDDGDEITATTTQTSQFGVQEARASGVIDINADGDFGRGRSLFSTVFELSDPATDFKLRYGVSAEGDFPAPVRRVFNAKVSLLRLDGAGDTPVVPPVDIDLFVDAADGPTSASDSTSGTLAAGRYSLLFDLEGFPGGFDTSTRASYDVALTFTDAPTPNPIPLPPAAWAALTTMGGFGAVKGLRRVRRT